jgi:hypothetical protein
VCVQIVFGAEHEISVAEIEDNALPRLYVRRGGIAAFCADPTFWRLLDAGAVCVAFEDRLDAHAVLEAFTEAKRRRLN